MNEDRVENTGKIEDCGNLVIKYFCAWCCPCVWIPYMFGVPLDGFADGIYEALTCYDCRKCCGCVKEDN